MLGWCFEKIFPRYLPYRGCRDRAEHLMDGEGRSATSHSASQVAEIVGVCRLWARGRPNSANFCSGAKRMGAGTIRLRKSLYGAQPTSAVRQNIALCPKVRRKEGVLVSEPCISIFRGLPRQICEPVFLIVRTARLRMPRSSWATSGSSRPRVSGVKYLSGGQPQKVAVR
jgi:ABC-type sugar transport system ATPase subunit